MMFAFVMKCCIGAFVPGSIHLTTVIEYMVRIYKSRECSFVILLLHSSQYGEEKHKVNYAGREDHNHKFEKSPKEFIYSHTILLFSILQVWHDG